MNGSELFPIVTDTVKPIGSAVGGTLAEVWQGVLGDRVTAWRIRNAAALNLKLGNELAKTGQALNLDKIPEGVAYAWFQRATEADDPEIQELFAKLIANAAAGSGEALKKRNIDLVSRLTPDDAKLLSMLAVKLNENLRRWSKRSAQIDIDWGYATWLKQNGLEGSDAIDSLLSLGVIRHDKTVSVNSTSAERAIKAASSKNSGGWNLNYHLDDMVSTHESLDLTMVGFSLIEALFPIAMQPAPKGE